MADFNAKTATPDSSIADDNSILIGADSQSSATPSVYSFGTIKAWIKSWIGQGDVGLGNVTNNAQLTVANNLSDVADLTTSRSNITLGYGGARARFYAYHDCIINSIEDKFAAVSSGTGAAVSAVAVGALNALGVLSLDLGTTTTGRAAIMPNGLSSSINVLVLGLGRTRFSAKAAIHTLSNGTDTYTTRIGLIDAANAESVDGCFFRYTNGTNSGKWQAVTRSNGTETATDTGVTVVADAWKLFEIDVNAAGTSVVFKIDGSTVATNSTNIPTGTGRETGYGAMSLKSAGTTGTSGLYIDFMEVETIFTSTR